ncbi:hypothetical protein IMG5_119350, partial [Ichthyophthirius multifiliis]
MSLMRHQGILFFGMGNILHRLLKIQLWVFGNKDCSVDNNDFINDCYYGRSQCIDSYYGTNCDKVMCPGSICFYDEIVLMVNVIVIQKKSQILLLNMFLKIAQLLIVIKIVIILVFVIDIIPKVNVFVIKVKKKVWIIVSLLFVQMIVLIM